MKKKLIRIILTALLLIGAYIVERTCALPMWQLLLVYLVPYLIIGYDVLGEAVEGVAHGELFDEHFLMSIATVGALCIGFLPGAEAQFPEAVFVMLFFQVGELFEGYAEGKSRRAVSHLLEIRPDTANVLRDGVEQTVAPEEVAVGETIIIKPGERVPLDGFIIEGSSALNTVALTGESVPRSVTIEDEVMSGCVNLSGLLTVCVAKTAGDSTASKIIEMVEHATDHKSRSETFIRRFARVYTPVVVIVALLLAFIPPLLMGSFTDHFATWLYRALTFLVISCPCALVISIPLSFFAGIGGASRAGILVKGANYMDALAKARAVLFDKTGTLTKGSFTANAVHPTACEANHLLHMVAHVERHSTHPIATSLRNAYPNEQDECSIEEVEELAGRGVKARVNGSEVHVGNVALMESIGAQWQPCDHAGTIVHAAIDGTYAGHIVVSDTIKEESKQTIEELSRLGIHQLVMLTGDHEDAAREVAQQVGITEYYADLLPADKLTRLETILDQPAHGTVLFVGDGINDAPVLARADVGIAMGGLGSDAAIEAADVVIMDDNPLKIATAIRIARRTVSIALQNAWFAIGIKILVLLLALLGVASMWMAVFADVGVTVLAVLNAMRALRPVK
ncbi:heavy metal translocating P-type ATPase [uncultured Porphyromonas sp.]|jgi:Cd2+/Zn2+-exporting ATPase|uniref:heavy metal translocating P-type ATPase n=1 Tax=uncultured Porphyromonas sp. TaxID=159274 RepID=UPI0026102826|nr:heavy metal translocating P-type ATPase [uncultured Porphyromonas sp.]